MSSRKKASLLILFVILITSTAVFAVREGKIIGEITGPEWNNLKIGETEYRLTGGMGYTAADRGRYLGKAKYYENTIVRLYSVKDDEEGKYIYAVWDWEGFFYVREE